MRLMVSDTNAFGMLCDDVRPKTNGMHIYTFEVLFDTIQKSKRDEEQKKQIFAYVRIEILISNEFFFLRSKITFRFLEQMFFSHESLLNG